MWFPMIYIAQTLSKECIFIHVSIYVATCEWKQIGAFFLRLFLTRTTIMLSNVVGPAEHITLCGHPVVFMAGSVYGQPQVSYSRSYLQSTYPE
jgi:hypothetical protein